MLVGWETLRGQQRAGVRVEVDLSLACANPCGVRLRHRGGVILRVAVDGILEADG